MAASMSNEPTRTASRATMPPREITAVSLVPPPMSITMFPTGSSIGRSAPIAAAIGCSMRFASAAPARRAASVTARRSTSVIADGTQMTTFGLVNLLTPTRCSNRRIIRSVISKSVIAPPQRPHRNDVTRCTANHLPCSRPVASTSPVCRLSAITEGSFNTMPLPSYTPGVCGAEVNRKVTSHWIHPLRLQMTRQKSDEPVRSRSCGHRTTVH